MGVERVERRVEWRVEVVVLIPSESLLMTTEESSNRQCQRQLMTLRGAVTSYLSQAFNFTNGKIQKLINFGKFTQTHTEFWVQVYKLRNPKWARGIIKPRVE